MHPRSRGGRPGREDNVFHVTKSGLEHHISVSAHIVLTIRHVLLLVRERRVNRLATSQSAIKGVKCMEAVLWSSSFVLYDGFDIILRIRGR